MLKLQPSDNGMDSRLLGVSSDSKLWVEIHPKALRGRYGGAVHQSEPAAFRCGQVGSLHGPSGRTPSGSGSGCSSATAELKVISGWQPNSQVRRLAPYFNPSMPGKLLPTTLSGQLPKSMSPRRLGHSHLSPYPGVEGCRICNSLVRLPVGGGGRLLYEPPPLPLHLPWV